MTLNFKQNIAEKNHDLADIHNITTHMLSLHLKELVAQRNYHVVSMKILMT